MKKNIQMIRNVGGRLNYLIEGKNIIYQVTSHMLLKKKNNNIFYFCTNHRINTIYKKFLFGKKNAMGK